jgi:hypothetical protein
MSSCKIDNFGSEPQPLLSLILFQALNLRLFHHLSQPLKSIQKLHLCKTLNNHLPLHSSSSRLIPLLLQVGMNLKLLLTFSSQSYLYVVTTESYTSATTTSSERYTPSSPTPSLTRLRLLPHESITPAFPDPLGPSIPFPFLPAGSDNGKENVLYSCHPGGPKLFDLLGILPYEPYGVLAWTVVDREEELFEVDDVRDEDKVMEALWSRWIMLNQ